MKNMSLEDNIDEFVKKTGYSKEELYYIKDNTNLIFDIITMINDTDHKLMDVLKKMKKKKDELKGLITDSGALFVISRELGITLPSDDEKKKEFKNLDVPLKIGDITNGMKNIGIKGTIKQMRDVITYTKKDGEEGRLRKLILEDDTGEINIVVWRESLIDLLEKLTEGLDIEIINGYTRINKYKGTETLEIHLGKFCDIKII